MRHPAARHLLEIARVNGLQTDTLLITLVLGRGCRWCSRLRPTDVDQRWSLRDEATSHEEPASEHRRLLELVRRDDRVTLVNGCLYVRAVYIGADDVSAIIVSGRSLLRACC